MALKKDYQFDAELVAHLSWGETLAEKKTVALKDAYIKVHRVEGSKDELLATVLITSGTKKIANVYSFVPSMSDANFIKQAYAHLKTLPEFEGAVDC